MIDNDQSKIRRFHSQLLFKLVKDYGPISRVDLARMTQMSGTSVGKIVKELIEQDFVHEVGQTESSIGRKAVLLEINPRGVLTIGVSVDTDACKVGIVDLRGNLIAENTTSVDLSRSAEDILKDMAIEIRKIGESIGPLSDKIAGVGVTIPGIISWPDGVVQASPQMRWRNLGVRKYLQEALEKPVFVDNQVKCALFGESFYGDIVGMRDCVCIWVGSGVGGAVMEDGVILRGGKNALGEIGHMTIDPSGPLCDCGRFGCMQTFICSSALEKEANCSMETIFAAERRQEAWAVRLIDRATKYLAIAISNAVCMYNPQVIVLAGSMVDRWPEWTRRVQGLYKEYLWEPLQDSFEVRCAKTSETSGILGASALVISELLQSPFKSQEIVSL